MNTAQLRKLRAGNAVLALHAAIDDSGLLVNGGLLNLQTGTGKTWMSRKAAVMALATGGRVVYVCPLRSLAREVAREWSAAPEMAGIKVGLFTGEVGADDGSEYVSPRDAQLIVITAEKLDSYLRSWWKQADWLADLALVIVDEIHTVGDGARGAALDGMLTRLRQVNPYARLLCLTATMGNVSEVAEWLGVEAVSSRIRWVPLTWRVATFRPGQGGMANRTAAVVREVRETAGAGGQTLVFVQSRLRAEQLAGALQKEGIRSRAHHAGLGAEEREEIEGLMRVGDVQCVVATGTLSMGLNLPVRKVIVHDLQRYEQGKAVPLSVIDVWQLGGRAGRKGLDESGEVVLLAGQHESGNAWQYTKGVFERVTSRMGEQANMAGQVLAMVGSRLATSPGQLKRLMGKSLAAKQNESFTDGVVPCVDEMVDAGMVVYKGEDLVATRVGYAAVRHMISPATANAWLWAIEEAGDELRFMDLLVLAACAKECGLKLRVRKDQLATVGALMRHEPMWLRSKGADFFAKATGQTEGASVIAGMAAASVMREWSRQSDAAKAGGAMGLSAGEVDDIRKEVLRTLVALKDVAAAAGPRRTKRTKGLSEEPKLGEKLRAVIAMTTCGLNARQATLSLVDGVGPSFARKLVDHGIGDITQLSQCQPHTLMEVHGVAEKRALSWIEKAQSLHVNGGAYRYRQADEWSGSLVEPESKQDAALLLSLWSLGKD
jgi:helicase